MSWLDRWVEIRRPCCCTVCLRSLTTHSQWRRARWPGVPPATSLTSSLHSPTVRSDFRVTDRSLTLFQAQFSTSVQGVIVSPKRVRVLLGVVCTYQRAEMKNWRWMCYVKESDRFTRNWLRGTVVFGRRTFPVLRPTCCGRMTTYVGKPSAIYRSTNQANSAFHSFGVDRWVVSCNWMSLTSIRGGAIWWTLTKDRQAWCICR